MKILLVTQEFPPDVLGGVGYHAYHLADALVDQGHTVHVLTGESAGHRSDDSLPGLPEVTFTTLAYRRTFAPRLWFARRAHRWLRSWDRLSEYDLVHAHEYLDFDRFEFEGRTLQKVHFNLTEKPTYLSLPRVPWPVDRIACTLANATIWRAERRLERRALQTADCAVANSRLTRTICYDRHGLGDRNIDVVYNGVDVDRFGPSPAASDDDYLLYVGGDQERKGFSALMGAVRRLGSQAGFEIRIVGSTPSVDTQHLESELPVEFLGRVPRRRLPALYQHAAGLVHPAVYEPFGNVVLEALACGTPVVVSDPSRCGAAELIDGETGIVTDPENHDETAEAMRTVIHSPDRFPAEGCRSLAARHTWGHVADRTIDIARADR